VNVLPPNIFELVPVIEGDEVWPPLLIEELQNSYGVTQRMELPEALDVDFEMTEFYVTCDFCPGIGHVMAMNAYLANNKGGALNACDFCSKRIDDVLENALTGA